MMKLLATSLVILFATPAWADFCLIRDWDASNRPNGVGRYETAIEAQENVDFQISRGFVNAFFIDDSSSTNGEECWRVPRHWVVDPVAKTASLDVASLTVEWRDRRKAEVPIERDRRLEAGLVVGTTLYKTDTQAIAKLTGFLKWAERKEAAGGTINRKFRTASGVNVTVTAASQVGALVDAVGNYALDVEDAAATLAEQIEGMTLADLEALRVSDWTGWP